MDEKRIEKFVEEIELISISLEKLNYQLFEKNSLKENGPIQIRFGFESENPEIKNDEDFIVIKQPISYEMLIDPKEKNATKLFELFATFLVEINSKEHYSNKIIDEYSKNYLPRILHPYLRELISDSLNRVNLPNLPIPIYESL